jgi:serine protease Do
MGVTLESVTPELAPQFGLKDDKGAIVADVTPNAPGAKAGLKSGDVITAIDGKPVKGSDDLTLDVISHEPGATVSLSVMRNGSPTTVKVELGQRPGGVDWDKNGPKSDDNQGGDSDNGSSTSASVRGITVEALSPDVAQQVGVPPSTKGVVVTSVDADSPAADSVGRGSIIVAVDRHPVATISDFRQQMEAAKDKPVLLTVNNGGSTGFVVVQPK